MNINDILNAPDLPAIKARFYAHVKVNPATGCHEWQGSIGKGKILPYGRFPVRGRKYPAHRAAWVISKGAIPEGLWVLHRCDVAGCVNPAHLFLGDRAANMADMAAKNRSVSGQKNWTNKLTPDQVQAIRLAPGRQRDIADQYGIGQNNVSRIKRGETWVHLPWPVKG